MSPGVREAASRDLPGPINTSELLKCQGCYHVLSTHQTPGPSSTPPPRAQPHQPLAHNHQCSQWL